MISGQHSIRTNKVMELVDITTLVNTEITNSGIDRGLCFLFNPQTTAGLTINEGADPDVQTDIIAGFREMVPMNFPFKHMEGNSPAHIMASLMGASLTIAIDNNKIQLGTWQRVFFCEFDGPRTRKIHWRLLKTN